MIKDITISFLKYVFFRDFFTKCIIEVNNTHNSLDYNNKAYIIDNKSEHNFKTFRCIYQSP